MGAAKALVALLKKNLLMKRVNLGSSIFEFFLPIIMFYLVSNVVKGLNNTYYVDPNLQPQLLTDTLSMVEVEAELGDFCDEQFDSSSCSKVAIVGKNHPLTPIMLDMLKSIAPPGRAQWERNWVEFETLEDLYKYNKQGNFRDHVANVAIEWLHPAEKPLKDLNIDELNHAPQWGFKVHSIDIATGTDSVLYDLYRAQPSKFGNSKVHSAQVLVNQAILRYNGLYGPDSFNYGKNLLNIALYPVTMAEHGYYNDEMMSIMVPFAGTIGALSFLPTISSVVSVVVQEKESFLRQSLVMMGATKWIMYASWFVLQYCFALLPLSAVSYFVGHYVCPQIPKLLIFWCFSFYYLTLVAFALIISAFFTKAKTAQAVSSVVYLVMTVIGAFSVMLPSWLAKILTVASLQSLLSQLLRNLFDMNRVMSADKLPLFDALTKNLNSGLSFMGCFVICTIQVFIYFSITIYIDNIIPGEYNNPLPFYYPFLPSYWCGNGRKRGDRSNGYSQIDTPAIDATSSLLENSTSPSSPSPTPKSTFIQPLTQREEDRVCVRFRDVVKSFKGPEGDYFNAVDHLSTEFLKGELFTLLGHNGAGKSTAINMLTGIYGPTSGNIELYDRNGEFIETSFSRGRIGVCPQYNALYPKLTVLDHLRLFSAIKQSAMGIEISEIDQSTEFNQILHMLKLGPSFDNKQDSPVESLSGGQKRKTCLAIALLHKPSLLILDEPTTGTDVAVQREIWALLGQLKRDSCILLSTHHLEEAEVGDRIGIMVKGQMMCSGNSMFLKQQFGVGYNLSLEKMRFPGLFDRVTAIDTSVNQNQNDKTFGGAHGAEISTISGQRLMKVFKPKWTQKNLPPLPEELSARGIQLTQDQQDTLKYKLDVQLTNEELALFDQVSLHSDTQSNLSLSIPYSEGDIIPDILDLLEKLIDKLNIVDTSLSITSLEDVFIKANNGSTLGNAQNPLFNSHDDDSSLFMNVQNTPLIDDTAQNSLNSKVNDDTNRIEINTSIWDMERPKVAPVQLFLIQFYTLFWKRLLLQLRDKKSLFRLFLLPLLLCGLLIIQTRMISRSPPIDVHYRDFPNHTPIHYSKVDLPTLTPPDVWDPDYVKAIQDANSFSKSYATYSKSTPFEDNISEYLNFQHPPREPGFIVQMSYGQHTLDLSKQHEKSSPIYTMPLTRSANLDANNFAVNGLILYNSTSAYSSYAFLQRGYETIAEITGLPHSDKLMAKFGQVLNLDVSFQSLPSPAVAITSMFLGICITMVCAFVYPETLIHLLVHERAERVVHLHRISGVGTFAYWAAYFVFDMIIYVIMMGITVGSLLIFKIEHPPLRILLPALAVYGPIVILYTYTLSLFFSKPTSAQIVIMTSLTVGPFLLILLITLICLTFRVGEFWRFFPIALIIPSSGIVWPLFQSLVRPDVAWFYSLLRNWSFSIPIYLALFCVILGVQNRHWLEELFSTPQNIKQRSDGNIDPDVIAQEEMIKSGQYDSNEYPLVSHGLRKVFGGHTAVNNLYFAMQKSTVFGLLGSNGAGKTTTIAMLTSDYISSKSTESQSFPALVKHTAFLNGHDIIQENEECWTQLGFCPQFDALNLALTGRETLTLYCWLRGVTGDICKLFVKDLLNALGLEYAADRRADSYSLGMRRRLSLGVALVGNPKVIIADECTSGVDAISRANIRLLLQQTCKNRALLITSHDLAEIEMLADNIGIMSRGEMKTIGSKNNLKSKLTNHHQLQIHTTSGYEQESCVRVLSALTGIMINPELDFLIRSLSFYQKASADESRMLGDSHGSVGGGYTDSIAAVGNNGSDLNMGNVGQNNNNNNNNQNLFTNTSQNNYQNNNQYRKITQDELTTHPAYLDFMYQCRAHNGGCYITECRHTTGIINISRQLYTLSGLFKKTKDIQGKISPELLLTYSCQQVPLEQVFLEIVRRDEEMLAKNQGRVNYTQSVHGVPQQYQQQQYQQQQYQQQYQQQQQFQPQSQYHPQQQQYPQYGQQQPMQQQSGQQQQDNLFLSQQSQQPEEQFQPPDDSKKGL